MNLSNYHPIFIIQNYFACSLTSGRFRHEALARYSRERARGSGVRAQKPKKNEPQIDTDGIHALKALKSVIDIKSRHPVPASLCQSVSISGYSLFLSSSASRRSPREISHSLRQERNHSAQRFNGYSHFPNTLLAKNSFDLS